MARKSIEPLLSRDEVQAILETSKVARHQGLRSEPEPIDLLASDRSVQQMLPALHAGFVRLSEQLRKVLTSTMRMKVEVQGQTPEIMTGRGLARFTAQSACMIALHTRVRGIDKGYTVLTIDPVLAYSIVERVFGGASSSSPFIAQRPPTALEQRVILRILSSAVTALQDTLEPQGAFEFRIDRVESSLELVPGFTPDITLLHIPFSLRMGQENALLTVAMLTDALDPLKAQLCAPLHESTHESQDMPQLVPRIPVSLSVELGRTKLTLRQIMGLQKGMTFALDRHPSDELPVQVEGVVKFFGYPVHDNGALGLEITRSKL